MLRSRWMLLGFVALALVALAALWRYTPLVAWTDLERVTRWAQDLGARPWTPLAIIAAYSPAAVTLFPRPVITLFAVIALGPWFGFACAFTGILLAAVVTYGAGWRAPEKTVRRLAGPRVERVRKVLDRKGVLAVTAVRLLPLAPFAVVNVIAGALRIRFAHFVAGTALGILPGTATATVVGDQLVTALRAPSAVDLWLLGTVLLLVALATLVVRRWVFGPWARR
jgi:phospholipase D1/2